MHHPVAASGLDEATVHARVESVSMLDEWDAVPTEPEIVRRRDARQKARARAREKRSRAYIEQLHAVLESLNAR